MKVVLLNDTAARGRHVGCQLTIRAFRKAFADHDLDLIGTVPIGGDWSQYEIVDKADLIVVNGEGTIHHGRGQHLVSISGVHPSVLVNAVWQDNPPAHFGHASQFLFRSVRESSSQEQLPDSAVVPDMTFYLAEELAAEYEKDMRFEGGDGHITSVCKDKDLTFRANLSIMSPTFPALLARKQRVVTGRFHGITLAAMLGVPFSAFRSNTHKNYGLCMDMGVSHLYGPGDFAALCKLPDTLADSVVEYVLSAKRRISDMFASFHSLPLPQPMRGREPEQKVNG